MRSELARYTLATVGYGDMHPQTHFVLREAKYQSC